ncbi:hypothetical protein GGG16DRAFT_116527 [Schizophyllum commune]
MTPGSPTVFLLWTVLACLFLCFLLVHLWSYDRFKCLKWNAGKQPGAFNRLMTYTYILTVPLLLAFSASMTRLKYREGHVVLPSGQAVPRPVPAWSQESKDQLLPLLFVFSIAWAFEIVTHLEELMFWLFLLHQGPRKRDWFHSWEFRIWSLGSTTAIVGLPMTTLAARRDLDLCAAWIFLVGAVAGTVTTVWFLYVIGKFPTFIAQVKAGGAEPAVVVRLFRFYQLHTFRVVLRFFFTVPLLVLAADALAMGTHPIVHDPFWADFLLLIGGIGCFSSSALTLLIFFPRSFTQEMGYVVKVSPPPSRKRRSAAAAAPPAYPHYGHIHHPSTPKSPKSTVHAPPDIVYSPDAHLQMSAFEYPYRAPSYTTSTASSHRPSTSSESHVRSMASSEDAYARERDAYTGDEDAYAQRAEEERDVLAPPADVHGRGSDRLTWRSSETRVPGEGVPSPGTQRARTSGAETGDMSEEAPQMHPYVMAFTSPIDLPDLYSSPSSPSSHAHSGAHA